MSPPLDDDDSNRKKVHSARDERYARRALLQQQHHKQQNEIDEPPAMPPAPVNTCESRGNERRYTPFQNRILQHKQHFKKTYKDLRWKQRKERLDDAVSFIIACCLERKKMGKNGKDISYIFKNESFLHDCLNIINGLRERLCKKLDVDIPDNDIDVEPVHLVEDDSEKQSKIGIDTAMAILGECSGRGYERIRKEMMSSIPDLEIPSEYKVKKALPLKVEKVDFNEGGLDDNDDGYLDMMEMMTTVKEEHMYGTSQNRFEDTDAALQLFSHRDDLRIIGSKLSGGMQQWIDVMVQKYIDNGIMKVGDEVNEDLILINSFDGAESIRTEKELKGVISFSSQIYVPSAVNSQRLAVGSSFNILTWMQVIAKEALEVIQPCMKRFLEERKAILDGDIRASSFSSKKIWTYDVHDAKFLYLITQHSLWNRRHHPFLICKCKRGESFRVNHQCTVLTDEEYKQYWKDSSRKWEVQKEERPDWDVRKHKEWCDEMNFGVTHLGMDPDKLPMSTIRFDTFHMSCAIIRRVMDTLRKFLLRQSSSIVKSFTDDILSSFMTDYLIFCWNNKIKLTVFKGNDLILFACNTAAIVDFLNDKLYKTQELKNLCGGLLVLPKITKFLSMARIQNASLFEKILKDFKENVEKFFECGKMTYLKNLEDESFYFHCLRYYVPSIAEITYKRHKVGIGIFTMQGFERRNKESKNVIRKFTSYNRKSEALLTNTLQRLLMVFWNENNAC